MVSFNELKRNLKKDFSGFEKIKLALLSDSASQLLNEAIRAYGYEAKQDLEIYEADYNQIDLQVFDPASELYNFKPDFIFINRSTEKLLVDFYKENKQSQKDFSKNIIAETKDYYDVIKKQLKSKIIINTFPEINDSVFGNFAAKTEYSFIYQLRKANVALMDLSREAKDMLVCDLASIQSELGYRFVFDPKMYVTADMVYSLDFLPYIASSITSVIQSVTGTFMKCLVLDLDNTMWGGVIGDEGMEGIELGHFGLGKIYTEFQLWVKQLKERGIIIAVCSKNTEEVAKAPFLAHPDMVLHIDDIAVFLANWENKADNIRYLQSVLNIGFDSMVFVDDSRFEREMVRSALPEITVPELPEDPAEYLLYLRTLNLFETASYTEEDEMRTRHYQQAAERNMLLPGFDNRDDFLKDLGMAAEVRKLDDFTIPRVAQLTQRSNQFNLRTVRYTEEDLRRISKDPQYYVMSLSLKDRFGDHGLVGVVILKKESEETLFIDSWIMSCRVLKRGMENFTLNVIAELAAANNFKKLIGEYIPTKKNGIVMDHYRDLGFESIGDGWVLDVAGYKRNDTFINANITF